MDKFEVVAGNGLLHRRAFLRGSSAFAAAVTGYALSRTATAAPLADAPWSREPALHDQPFRRAGHRPGPAQARDPRHGQAAAGLHGGVAVALPDGIAHGI